MLTATEARKLMVRHLRADSRAAKVDARIESSVTRTRGVCGSRPCVAGTRIHVEICISKLRYCYPYLRRQQIEDVIRWWGRHGAKWRKVSIQPYRGPKVARTRAAGGRL